MGDHSPLMFALKTWLEEGLVLARWNHLDQSAHLTCEEMKAFKAAQGQTAGYSQIWGKTNVILLSPGF